MEAFVLKTLKKVRKEAPRRFKDLRSICDDLIEVLSENQKVAAKSRGDTDADKYFDPLQAACETRQPKLMEIALDAIHFLIEHAYLRGSKRIVVQGKITGEDVDTKPSERRTLMDLVIETVARCSEEFDDAVHLQVIKTLLMAVTSQNCQVHEASLLLAVRSCFHIHLITKSQVNKTTAKAALTQMLSVVFLRMESFDARAKMETEVALAALHNQVEDDSENIPSVPCGDAMYPEVYGSLCYKPSGGAPTPFAGFDSAAATIGHVFPSILHKDAFLIFRALCKLSMKGLQDDSTPQNDPIALQNKILSLELILHILERSGPAFKSGDKFIFAIRQYMCVSLLGNCTSHVAQVTGLSLRVFVSLLEGFKAHLKAELEVFITNIFLRILESENSTFDHKIRVLEVFHNICRDPGAQVELFINYDCDFEAIDLFRRIVDAFAKIAKNVGATRNSDFMSRRGPSDESTIRFMGLEGLIIILRSLVKSGGTVLETSRSDAAASPSKRQAGTKPSLDETDRRADDEEELSTLSLNGKFSSASGGGNEVEDGEEVKEGGHLVQSYDRKQKLQEELETGVLKFNQSPKKGLAYLAAHGHIDLTPEGVAKFFRQYVDKLDKTAIGEYLGREVQYEGGFCVKVLHEYVDMMDFSDMHFDEAIRTFLSGFRLPGEAQKIDRMMEKFAERYYIQNRNVFASADMAFILAFSTIMLQTNLHNPAIRDDKRMTKEQFIRQNTGISSDGELPESMLIDIYDRIQANPISLSSDDKLKNRAKKEDVPFSVFNDERKRKKDAFNDERKEMVRASEAIFKQKLRSKGANRSVFVRAAQGDVAYVRPMFEVAWAPMIGVLSQTLEMSEDPEVIALCLEGVQLAIRIASRMDVPTARDTYVNSLARFTTLETVKEMRQKHVDGVKMLINVALTDGDYMMESWGQILRCLSQLARLQLFGNGLHSDDMFFSESSQDMGKNGKRRVTSTSGSAQASNMDPFTKLFSSPTRAETSRIIEESNAELVMREIDPVFIDRIFINSQNMSTESVLHFVNNLCAVSLEEISTTSCLMGMLKGKDVTPADVSSTPRVFSLQKLVEVADFNMHVRPRIAWTKLWSVLAVHFTTVGVHSNHALAMYAIDSLKQLSIKFLQKAELSNFNFQRLFLKPFEIIMTRATSTEIHELILRCLDIMIRACASNIRSGWRSIFSIFSVAATHDKQDIAGIAFEITERLMTQQFDLLIFDFVELMNCLVAFVAGPHSLISLSALARLSQCADHLAEGTIEPALHAQHSSTDAMGISWEKSKMTQIGEDAAVFRLWWPLLLGLATRVADSRLIIRTRAIETLHRVLRAYGDLFSTQTWEVIFKGVLFPMIDSAKTDSTPQPQSAWPSHNPTQSKDSSSWIATTAATALSVCLSLFSQHYEAGLTSPLLSEVIGMLEGCISQDIESLSRMGLSALGELVTTIPLSKETNTLTPAVASLICSRFSQIGLNNFTLDFGDCGSLVLDSKVPPIVQQMTSTIEAKRADGDSSGAVLLQTPYGEGRVVSTENEGNLVKQIIILSGWGAQLISFDKYPPASVRSEERSLLTPRLTKEQAWAQLSSRAMTSMVLFLDYVRVMGDMLNTHYNSWSVSQLPVLMGTLQCCYDYARCFNAGVALRSQLKAKNFMRFRDNPARLPHLFEQETQSAAQILAIAFRLYEQEGESLTGDAKARLAEPIIKRITLNLSERYMLIDEASLMSSEFFLGEQLAAYAPPLMIAIKGLTDIKPEQFKRNIDWLSCFLSSISLCNDRMIRTCVKLVYEKQVNPLLVSLVLRQENSADE